MHQLKEKSICILEPPQELIKDYCLRSDSALIIQELSQLGWHGQAVIYNPDDPDLTYAEVSKNFCAFMNRYNPEQTERPQFEAMLRKLADQAGLVAMNHPDLELSFCQKDILAKLNKTGLVPEGTVAYETMEEMYTGFPQTLANGPRVLKENIGAYGTGVWKIQLLDEGSIKAGVVSLDAKVRCTDAKDDAMHYETVEEVIKKCERQLQSEEGKIIDMQFLPRISEGEIRVQLIGSQPTYIVMKTPFDTENTFGTNLCSAGLTFFNKDEYPEVTELLKEKMPALLEATGQTEYPLIWTADFIGMGQPGEKRYSLGEINCWFITLRLFLEKGTERQIAKEVARRASRT